jgi:hypothetical protein
MRPRRLWRTFFFAPVLVFACSSSDKADDPCKPDDADGVVGVDITVAVTVDDTSFQPAIIKTQNTSMVTLTLKNTGTRPHGFAVDCLPTPNTKGCPTTSCFPPEATIAPIAPGASTTVKLKTPTVEGIYTYRSSAGGDSATGQFILQ